MSVTTCDLVRAQAITLRQAPIHPERFALMYRHRYLGGADPEAFDRLRVTTNECDGPAPQLFSERDSSARWRRFEIDRERALAIRSFDRSHGGPVPASLAQHSAYEAGPKPAMQQRE